MTGTTPASASPSTSPSPSTSASPSAPSSARAAAPGATRDQSLEERLDALRTRLADDAFLRNQGLSNEVGFHIFAYRAERELDVRAWTRRLVADSEAGRIASASGITVSVRERNLWEVFTQICQDSLGERWREKMLQLEERRGSTSLLARIQKIATAERYVRQMDWAGHAPGDVLLITGVGMVYPFMRLHNVLENAQSVFDDIPVVALYPGTYDRRSLALFGTLEDGNYYRAFAPH